MRRIFASILVVLGLSTIATSQIDRSGLIFGFGLGAGYSQHADSYNELDTLLFNHVEGFSGLRVMTVDLKLGWAFNNQLMAHLALKYTPPATVSPYRSTYQGFALSYSPKSIKELIITGGIGNNKTRDKRDDLGRGLLTNIGVGYEFSPNFIVETYAVFGKMDNTAVLGRSVSSSREFFLNLSFGYLFYRKPKSPITPTTSN